MSMDLEVKKFSYSPEYLLAGTDIRVTTAVKKAGADLKVGAPVKLDSRTDKVLPVGKSDGKSDGVAALYGIATEDFKVDEEAVIYLTGEFFADRLALETGVTAASLEVAFRNIGIFLK